MDKIRQSLMRESKLHVASLARTLSWLIALIGGLALLLSVASPADDAVQHELAPGRTRHVLRLSRANRPATPLTRGIAILGTGIVPSRVSHRWMPVPAKNVLTSDETHACPTGDRSPPHSLI